MSKKQLFSTRSLCQAAIIAALYAALTLALPAISYGEWQCRISEALTLLPVLMPQAIPGLTVGCLLANLMSPVGAADIIFGTLATLIAALGTWKFRSNMVLAAACPVLSNGIIIGAMLSIFYGLPLWLTMIQVAVGELVAVLLGVALMHGLKKLDLKLLK